MGQDELPAADMAAVREAVLGFYEESIRPLVAQRRGRGPRRLLRNRRLLWLNVLLLPGLLIELVRMALAHRGPELMVCLQRAVGLYRQLSGTDPAVAQAELWRIHRQLAAIDERVKPYSAWLATAAPADRAELAAAAGVLPAYHLGGRQTDDALLAEIRLPGWSTRPLGSSAWTGRWGGLRGVRRHRRRSSPVGGGGDDAFGGVYILARRDGTWRVVDMERGWIA